MEDRTRLWILLGKKISGEITSAESEEFDQLCMQQKITGTKEFDSLMHEYWDRQNSSGENEKIVTRGREVYDTQISPYVNADLPHLVKPKPVITFLNNWRRIAAAVFILVGCGAAFFFILWSSQKETVSTTMGVKKKITLPDGTLVWLNSGSSLSYSKNFNQLSTREVSLKGEAFFEVLHNEDHPFIIHTQSGISIKDVGTTFNIKAYTNEPVEATLISGAIEIFSKENNEKKLLLTPHQKVVIQSREIAKDSAILHVAQDEENNIVETGELNQKHYKIERVHPMVQGNTGDSLITEVAWTANELAFNSQKLSNLAKNMERWYDVSITIADPEVANYTFTGVFKEEKLVDALKELQMIRPFKFTIKDKHVLIFK